MQPIVNTLSTPLGAEVIGVDLKEKLSTSDIDSLYNLLHQHKLLVFRGQKMTPEEQITACAQFGEIEPHPAKTVPWVHRELTYVANTDPTLTQIYPHSGPPFELWHSDTCYLPNPARISLLYAERVPNEGGETLFANMVQAYVDLPEAIKNTLVNKKAVFGSSQQLMRRCHERGYPIQIPVDEMEPDVEHPVIRTHPYTKQQAIFVNWAHTDRIIDMPEDESDDMLAYLYQHARQEQYIYAHHPQVGDLMVWDNAALIHSNTDKKLQDIRVMRRVMIKGTKPF